MPKSTRRILILVWLGWLLVLYGFQSLVAARLGLMRPDLAVAWSRSETMATSNRGKIYLLEPFMNRQVAWDSEYYVGIAVGGYDDPEAGAVTSTASGEPVIKNYSFQSMARYVLISPPLYIFLAYLGRNKAFDRIWTLASVLLLGMSAMLFAFDMWVG